MVKEIELALNLSLFWSNSILYQSYVRTCKSGCL